MGSSKQYPLTARVWYRESTAEWVLDIEGSVEDTYLQVRHTAPGTIPPDEVPGLDHLYEQLDKLQQEVKRLRPPGRVPLERQVPRDPIVIGEIIVPYSEWKTREARTTIPGPHRRTRFVMTDRPDRIVAQLAPLHRPLPEFHVKTEKVDDHDRLWLKISLSVHWADHSVYADVVGCYMVFNDADERLLWKLRQRLDR